MTTIMIKAIIFDLDDVIVNSSPIHFKAYERALQDFGIPTPKIPADLRRQIYGMRIKEIMHLLATEFKMNVDVGELTRHRNKYFMELVHEGIEPMPGLYKLIGDIESWKLKRAVASSGVKEYVDEVLDQLDIKDFFEQVVTGDDVKNPKPAPDCFLMAAKKLGIEPSSCAVLEDSTNGLVAAKGAGMIAIGVKNSVIDSKQDMSMADIVVDRLDKITSKMLQNICSPDL